MEDSNISVPNKRETDRARMNEQINVPEIRLIGADGSQLGIVKTKDAILQAKEEDMDLIEISPTARPPVCKIMDYGKFLFELSKKLSEAKKKQRESQPQLKEIKFRPGTEEGDYQVKLRNLTRFIQNGDKVKVTLRFRGREMAHQDLGMKLMERLQSDTTEFAITEQQAKREGRQLLMVLAPKRK